VVRAARGAGGAGLLLGVLQPRLRLGDLSLERSDLFGAHAGIDVVAVGSRSGQSRARLPNRRGQLDLPHLGDDLPRPNVISLSPLDGRELAADLGRDPNFGRA